MKTSPHILTITIGIVLCLSSVITIAYAIPAWSSFNAAYLIAGSLILLALALLTAALMPRNSREDHVVSREPGSAWSADSSY